MRRFMPYPFQILLGLLLLSLVFLSSCDKQTTYVYDVDDVQVNKPASEKNNLKSQTEFIAIAYADLTGSNISMADLDELLAPYRAFGDQKLIEQMIIKGFLGETNINVPTEQEMLADTELFTVEMYKRFYNREPDEFELWYVKKLLDAGEVAPETIYFAIMTSDEYRYY